MTKFTFHVSLSGNYEKPAPKDANNEDVPVVEVPLSDLQIVQVVLAEETSDDILLPYNYNLPAAGEKLIRGIPLWYVAKFLCNSSRPDGKYWTPTKYLYLHPLDSRNQLCIASDVVSGGRRKWFTLSILAEPMKTNDARALRRSRTKAARK